MTVYEVMTFIGFMITVFSAGVAVGKLIAGHNKNDRL